MIWVVPDPVTRLLVTSIVSTTELSEVLYKTILPVSTSTASENVNTILLLLATAIASSAGDELTKIGAITSPEVVNDNEVLSLIPA